MSTWRPLHIRQIERQLDKQKCSPTIFFIVTVFMTKYIFKRRVFKWVSESIQHGMYLYYGSEKKPAMHDLGLRATS